MLRNFASFALLYNGGLIINVLLESGYDILPYEVGYLRARLFVMPFVLKNFVLNWVIRPFKDFETPLAIVVVANTLNITLDVIIIFYLRSRFVGAALARSVSQTVAFF